MMDPRSSAFISPISERVFVRDRRLVIQAIAALDGSDRMPEIGEFYADGVNDGSAFIGLHFTDLGARLCPRSQAGHPGHRGSRWIGSHARDRGILCRWSE